MSARVRVFIASSLDGFIAGPNDDLSSPSGRVIRCSRGSSSSIG